MLEWSELKLNKAISSKAYSTIAAPKIRFPSILIFYSLVQVYLMNQYHKQSLVADYTGVTKLP
jgi:hypothetical protein